MTELKGKNGEQNEAQCSKCGAYIKVRSTCPYCGLRAKRKP